MILGMDIGAFLIVYGFVSVVVFVCASGVLLEGMQVDIDVAFARSVLLGLAWPLTLVGVVLGIIWWIFKTAFRRD